VLQSAALPEHSVQVQPLLTQARLVPCVEHAAAVPSQTLPEPFQLQPLTVLQVGCETSVAQSWGLPLQVGVTVQPLAVAQRDEVSRTQLVAVPVQVWVTPPVPPPPDCPAVPPAPAVPAVPLPPAVPALSEPAVPPRPPSPLVPPVLVMPPVLTSTAPPSPALAPAMPASPG
jgi:hypothetical protein